MARPKPNRRHTARPRARTRPLQQKKRPTPLAAGGAASGRRSSVASARAGPDARARASPLKRLTGRGGRGGGERRSLPIAGRRRSRQAKAAHLSRDDRVTFAGAARRRARADAHVAAAHAPRGKIEFFWGLARPLVMMCGAMCARRPHRRSCPAPSWQIMRGVGGTGSASSALERAAAAGASYRDCWTRHTATEQFRRAVRSHEARGHRKRPESAVSSSGRSHAKRADAGNDDSLSCGGAAAMARGRIAGGSWGGGSGPCDGDPSL